MYRNVWWVVCHPFGFTSSSISGLLIFACSVFFLFQPLFYCGFFLPWFNCVILLHKLSQDSQWLKATHKSAKKTNWLCITEGGRMLGKECISFKFGIGLFTNFLTAWGKVRCGFSTSSNSVPVDYLHSAKSSTRSRWLLTCVAPLIIPEDLRVWILVFLLRMLPLLCK